MMINEPLEPPGTIAIIGAGPIGLEAALYGRFLGYDVNLFESHLIGQSWRQVDDPEQPLPFLPHRGLSSLAMTAVKTHQQAMGMPLQGLPITIHAWVTDALEILAQSDLLAGRVHTQCPVTAIEFAPDKGASADPSLPLDEVAEQPVRDFWLHLQADGQASTFQEAEVVIDTTEGQTYATQGTLLGSSLPEGSQDADYRTQTPYFYRLHVTHPESDESALTIARDRIRRLYAMLGSRESLDLYRPIRM